MRVSPLVFGKLRRSTLNPPINLVRDETAGIKSTGTVVVTVNKCQNQWRWSARIARALWAPSLCMLCLGETRRIVKVSGR